MVHQISPLTYQCPSCLKPKSVGIFRHEKAAIVLFINIWQWNEGDAPFFKCNLCDWSGKQLNLTHDQLVERNRKTCESCGVKFESDEFRFCPYCGCQRFSS